MTDKSVVNPLIPNEKIQETVLKMAQMLDQGLPKEPILMLGVLNGAATFMVDLARYMERKVYMEWTKVRTYEGT